MNITKPVIFFIGAFLILSGVPGQDIPESTYSASVSGIEDSLPEGYVPPLVSNGNLSMLVDYRGCQVQQSYSGMIPNIYWSGRRYSYPGDLIPFGHFYHETSINGKLCQTPEKWTQTLDTRNARVSCMNEYNNGLSVETEIFIPLSFNLIVIHKRLTVSNSDIRTADVKFIYGFTPPGNKNLAPERTTCNFFWNEKARCAGYQYKIDGYQQIGGQILLFSDKQFTTAVNGQIVTLHAKADFTGRKEAEITFYMLFSDSMEGKDYREKADKLHQEVINSGYNNILVQHDNGWKTYLGESYIHIPDQQLQRVYNTAQYHLRANATPWSFPVGIFPTHWHGRYLPVFDDMVCFHGLISSNHPEISKRLPDYYFSILPKAIARISHYNQPGTYGARFGTSNFEDGTDFAPQGFYRDHVFQNSHIASCAWMQYCYTGDLEYLKTTGYPLLKEIARFYITHMVYQDSNGSLFIGKCTDMERLGPAVTNPFLTACGAIYTMESAAKASEILNLDSQEAVVWKTTARKLLENLPAENGRYIPFARCKDRSVAVLAGLYPYPLFDKTNTLQVNAVYDFLNKGGQAGNMYPIGKKISPWYAGWLASAFTLLGDKTESVKLLKEASQGTGLFSEMFEINEPGIRMHPWFTTASGIYVFAMNQMLVQNKKDQILIAPAVPDSWSDFSCKLSCFGKLVITISVNKGKLTRLELTPGEASPETSRTLILPERLLDKKKLNKAVIASSGSEQGNCLLEVKINGPTHVIL